MPTYDARGNLTALGGAGYSYSSENLLVEATPAAGAALAIAHDPRLGPQNSNYTLLIILGGGIVIVGGIILAPEITIPGLIFGGGAATLSN